MKTLLNIDRNAKTVKGQAHGFMTGVLYAQPTAETCPFRSRACFIDCLNLSGRAVFSNVQAARARKTQWYLTDPESFVDQLKVEIAKLIKGASRKGLVPCFRLNGTSDIDWKPHGIIQAFPDIQSYDYTKDIDKLLTNNIKNYHLTFSRSESNEPDCLRALEAGFNVAIVFFDPKPVIDAGKFQIMGKEWPVINGDKHDLRFLDPQGGHIVALKAKGKARKDRSGFVL